MKVGEGARDRMRTMEKKVGRLSVFLRTQKEETFPTPSNLDENDDKERIEHADSLGMVEWYVDWLI